MKTRRLVTALALVTGVCGSAYGADFPVNHAVPDARLDKIRGGFDLGSLQASIGLERTVLINGVEAIRQSVNIPDVRNITAEQANALRSVMATTVVSNGADGVTTNALSTGAQPVPGVSVQTVGTSPVATPTQAAVSLPPSVANATLPSGLTPGLVIQNALDNQTINTTTTINASTNTSQMLQTMRIDESIRDAVIQFRGN
jgi:hypothetical protein